MTPADDQSIEVMLDLCLDRILKGQATIDMVLKEYPALVSELRPRLEAALWLTAQQTNINPRPEFINASSRRLMSRIQHESRLQKQNRQRSPSFWLNLITSKKMALQFGLVIIVVLSTVLFGGTVALAAQNAIPGEMLYPLKTSLESVQLAITTSPVKEAQLHIQYAERRLVEMQTLSAMNDYDNIDDAVSNMGDHIAQALNILGNQSIKDPTKTKELAMEMQRSLSRQELTLAYIKTKAPFTNQASLQRAISFSSQAVGITQNVIATISPETVSYTHL